MKDYVVKMEESLGCSTFSLVLIFLLEKEAICKILFHSGCFTNLIDGLIFNPK